MSESFEFPWTNTLTDEQVLRREGVKIIVRENQLQRIDRIGWTLVYCRKDKLYWGTWVPPGNPIPWDVARKAILN